MSNIPRWQPGPPPYGFHARCGPGTFGNNQQFCVAPPWEILFAKEFFGWKYQRLDMTDGLSGHLHWTWTIDRSNSGGSQRIIFRVRTRLTTGSIQVNEIETYIQPFEKRTLVLDFDFGPARHFDTVQYRFDAGTGPDNYSEFSIFPIEP